MSQDPPQLPRQYCTFWVSDHFFGIRVEQVQEILRRQETTPVPLTKAVVAGLINLRGQIVTAIDLRRRLGLPAREDGDLPVNVVCFTAEAPVSLVVDEIDDVLELDPAGLECPPAGLPAALEALVHEVYPLEGRLLLVLDAAEIADFDAAAPLLGVREGEHPRA